MTRSRLLLEGGGAESSELGFEFGLLAEQDAELALDGAEALGEALRLFLGRFFPPPAAFALLVLMAPWNFCMVPELITLIPQNSRHKIKNRCLWLGGDFVQVDYKGIVKV
jgi:hypothetical protein